MLRGEVAFSWSDLRYGKDSDLVDRWQLIHDRANSNSAALVAGGYIGAACDIVTFQGQIDTFKSWKGKPKSERSNQKALDAAHELESKNLSKIIDSLEERMVVFALSDADF